MVNQTLIKNIIGLDSCNIIPDSTDLLALILNLFLLQIFLMIIFLVLFHSFYDELLDTQQTLHASSFQIRNPPREIPVLL